MSDRPRRRDFLKRAAVAFAGLGAAVVGLPRLLDGPGELFAGGWDHYMLREDPLAHVPNEPGVGTIAEGPLGFIWYPEECSLEELQRQHALDRVWR